MSHEKPRPRRLLYVVLCHTGLPARLCTAREARWCAECLRVIKPGYHYTLRAVVLDGRRVMLPHCPDCVPWKGAEK